MTLTATFSPVALCIASFTFAKPPADMTMKHSLQFWCRYTSYIFATYIYNNSYFYSDSSSTNIKIENRPTMAYYMYNTSFTNECNIDVALVTILD